MAAVQRGECQRWAIDQKLTCFGVSLDGEAAFPSVEREIQVRELYTVGERGDYLSYSKNTYENTECHINHDGLLSRKIREHKGNRQGHVRASGHYKAYINPCLKALNASNLGFWIGPICITAVSVADDTYLLSGLPSSLQAALNIINFFGKRYRIIFNADKKIIVVTGSKIDMDYYRDISPWTLDSQPIAVTKTTNIWALSSLESMKKKRMLIPTLYNVESQYLDYLDPPLPSSACCPQQTDPSLENL